MVTLEGLVGICRDGVPLIFHSYGHYSYSHPTMSRYQTWRYTTPCATYYATAPYLKSSKPIRMVNASYPQGFYYRTKL